jgi:hypothetical protein
MDLGFSAACGDGRITPDSSDMASALTYHNADLSQLISLVWGDGQETQASP